MPEFDITLKLRVNAENLTIADNTAAVMTTLVQRCTRGITAVHVEKVEEIVVAHRLHSFLHDGPTLGAWERRQRGELVDAKVENGHATAVFVTGRDLGDETEAA